MVLATFVCCAGPRHSSACLTHAPRSNSGPTVAQTWRVTQFRNKPAKPPLDAEALERLALFYVGRYATTRAKLASYLDRKLEERGFGGRSRAGRERGQSSGWRRSAMSTTRRSRRCARAPSSAAAIGDRRIAQALRGAGVGDDDAETAREAVADGRMGRRDFASRGGGDSARSPNAAPSARRGKRRSLRSSARAIVSKRHD